jgi:hypothetical protein
MNTANVSTSDVVPEGFPTGHDLLHSPSHLPDARA